MPCTLGRKMPSPDQPVGVGGGLSEHPLLHAGAEHVGDRLVERPGLPLVGEPGGLLRERVRQLVAEHVDRLGEPVEDLLVAVAEDELGAVPEGVVVVRAVVHRGQHPGTVPVVGVATEDLAVEREGRGDPGGRLVDRRVAGLPLAGRAHQPSGQRRRVAGRVDRPVTGDGHVHTPAGGTRGAQRGVEDQGVRRAKRQVLVVAGTQPLEEVRRDEAADRSRDRRCHAVGHPLRVRATRAGRTSRK